MNPTKPIIAYLRVSTTHQKTEGVSLEAQEKRICDYALAQGTQVNSVYVDAISGARADNRPELQKALDEVCAIHGILVVYSLSRLARSTKDTIAIGERLENSGADLISLSENIDTTTAAGKMIFRLLAVLAEFERDLISERVSTALAYKSSRGERVSGRPPYGYKFRGDKLVADSETAPAVDAIMCLMEQGHGVRYIAKALNEAGFSAQSGGTWHPKVVASVVKRLKTRIS